MSILLETGDPITADFSFVRWIGDRKGIEERTKVWNRTLIDRTEELHDKGRSASPPVTMNAKSNSTAVDPIEPMIPV